MITKQRFTSKKTSLARWGWRGYPSLWWVGQPGQVKFRLWTLLQIRASPLPLLPPCSPSSLSLSLCHWKVGFEPRLRLKCHSKALCAHLTLWQNSFLPFTFEQPFCGQLIVVTCLLVQLTSHHNLCRSCVPRDLQGIWFQNFALGLKRKYIRIGE